MPWDAIDAKVDSLANAAAHLQHVVNVSSWSTEALGSALRVPGVLAVVRHLLVTPSAVGFSDGREIPMAMPLDQQAAEEVATLLLDIGLPRILPPGSSVKDLLRLGAIALDSRRRGFRRRDSVEAEVLSLLRKAIKIVRDTRDIEVKILPPGQWPTVARGRVENVLAVDGRPVAAVATFFAAQTGGRQQRTLMGTYPELQRDFDELPLFLVLILDGRGVKEAPTYVLQHLVRSVAVCMSRDEARRGALAAALAAAADRGGSRLGRRVAVDTLLTSALGQAREVRAELLPVARAEAVLALAEYKASHPDLALELDPNGVLAWSRPRQVEQAQDLHDRFEPQDAVNLLIGLLGMRRIREIDSEPDLTVVVAEAGAADPVLPHRLVIAGAATAPERDLFQIVARLNRQNASGSLAALLVPERGTSAALLASLQRQSATNVIVIDSDALLDLAGHISPRDAFVREVLRQADLTKANPFNPTGATPPQMFFGREEEEATLLATLHANSAALIGGRRIGKTSLLHHAVASMKDAGWNPFYADCQAVGDWADFREHVGPRWSVNLPTEFHASHLNLLIDQLSVRSTGKLVMVLDEVDNLLKWDQYEDEGRVGEAFFRACRALSQEGRAQFVFSGERLIATKLWDPSSPHWNFCRPLPIRQLTNRASSSLLTVPLEFLGVGLVPLPDAIAVAWYHTSGHPQILQELGTRLVHALNARPPDRRSVVDPRTIEGIVTSSEFARHYVETYWGQATTLEKLVSVLLADQETIDMHQLRSLLTGLCISHDAAQLSAALRMLSLYGVIEDASDAIALRALYLPQALASLGGSDALVRDLQRELGRATIKAQPDG